MPEIFTFADISNMYGEVLSDKHGKGSHTVWMHPALKTLEITLSGNDGQDAKPYQIKDVQNALQQLRREAYGY